MRYSVFTACTACHSNCAAPGAHVPELEIQEAQDKFVESKDLAETAMFNLLENDVSKSVIPMSVCLSVCLIRLHFC